MTRCLPLCENVWFPSSRLALGSRLTQCANSGSACRGPPRMRNVLICIPRNPNPSPIHLSWKRRPGLSPLRRYPEASPACKGCARDGLFADAQGKGCAALGNWWRTLRGAYADRAIAYTNEFPPWIPLESPSISLDRTCNYRGNDNDT